MSGGHYVEMYNVVQFFPDGTYEYVRERVSAEEASNAFTHYAHSVGARMGTTVRVIITDDGDSINAEWQFGKGLVFPTKDMLKPAANDAVEAPSKKT